jgi:1-acyl-sn-glycerol-3-phosphate acyltransferase
MKPLDYFWDTSASGKDAYPQRFCTFFFFLVRISFTPIFRLRVIFSDVAKFVRKQISGSVAQESRHTDGKSAGYIFCGNHRSYLDPVFVMLALRPMPIRFMAKEEFFANKVIARMASWVGAFPISRGKADMKSVKRSVAILKRGEPLGIFPEGTRVREGATRSKELHDGIALIAHLAHADVIPFRLWGTEKISPPGSKRWHFPKVELTFGEPLSLNDTKYNDMEKNERFAAFTRDCMNAVYALERKKPVAQTGGALNDAQAGVLNDVQTGALNDVQDGALDGSDGQ